jgi:ATP/maltotriose-dependent transcriptional regulator MalT
MPEARLTGPDGDPRSIAFLRSYELAIRANAVEISEILDRIPASSRLREPAVLALRGVLAVLRGDPQGGVALLTRAIDHEKSEARFYYIDLLVPLLVTRGAFDEAERLLDISPEVPDVMKPAFLSAKATIAARAGRDAESRALATAALAGIEPLDWPTMAARVLQRVSLAAFYRQDFDESHERGLESARMHERQGSFRAAAGAYSVLFILSYSHTGDLDMSRFYAERVSLNAKRAGDESLQNYGLVCQLHIAAESGDRRRLGSIRSRLLANPMHEQCTERSGFLISEALLAGWSGRFDSAEAALATMRAGESRVRGDRALSAALLAIAAAAKGDVEEARRLSRRAIGESAQRASHEARHELRTRSIARFLASAACFLIGDASRGVRALSRAFDPQGRFRKSLRADGVDLEEIPPLMRGYALYVNAAFAQVRRLRPVLGLTAAETDVLLMLPTGLTVAQIAIERGTAKKTVERQIESIYSKLGARNRTEAINRAREAGILT